MIPFHSLLQAEDFAGESFFLFFSCVCKWTGISSSSSLSLPDSREFSFSPNRFICWRSSPPLDTLPTWFVRSILRLLLQDLSWYCYFNPEECNNFRKLDFTPRPDSLDLCFSAYMRLFIHFILIIISFSLLFVHFPVINWCLLLAKIPGISSISRHIFPDCDWQHQPSFPSPSSSTPSTDFVKVIPGRDILLTRIKRIVR